MRRIEERTRRLTQLALSSGFVLHQNIGASRNTVVSIDEPKPLIRVFSPELQARPWGATLSGAFGLALRTSAGYETAVWHHIANYRHIAGPATDLDSVSDEWLLEGIRSELERLPCSISELKVFAADRNSWLGKMIGWGKEQELHFMRAAEAVSEDS